MFQIRKATIADCPAMMGLVNELAVFERAPDEVTVTLQHFEESGFGPNPVWWAHVATIDENIVGFALYYIRYSTWKGQRMYLEDLYIQEPYRKMGIGRALVENLIVEAKEKQFKGMTWQVLDWNEPAIEFYKKLGASFDAEWVNCSIGVE